MLTILYLAWRNLVVKANLPAPRARARLDTSYFVVPHTKGKMGPSNARAARVRMVNNWPDEFN